MERTKQFVDTSLIENITIEAFRSESFLIVNKKLVSTLGPKAAILLSYYIDRYKYFKSKSEENTGWFYFTHKQLIEQLNIKEYTIIKYKKVLKDLKILKTKWYGTPAKEWFKIDFVRLIKLIETGTPETGRLALSETGRLGDSETGRLYTISKLNTISKTDTIKKNISRSLNSPKKTKKGSYTERNKKYLPIAETLAKIILTKKNMKYTSIQISHWTNDIRQLVENNQVSMIRINVALSWYSKNIGGEYIPVIESGYSLKNKFTKLEDAMERKSFSKSKPPIRENGKTYFPDKDGDYFDKEGRPYM